MPNPPAVVTLTPMLRHYLEVKAEHPDALLFYRMGDFYEMFFEDAKRGAPILEVTLTARHKGTDSEVPMCGIPHHALETYLRRALEAGQKVVICDQTEDPAQAKGLVRREVTRVITPGTLSEPALLEGKEDNLLATAVWDGERGAGAFLDVSTGRFFVRRWATPAEGLDDLRLLVPRELLHGAGPLPAELVRWAEREARCTSTWPAERWPVGKKAIDLLCRQLGVMTLRGFGLEEPSAAGLTEPAITAAAGAVAYARATQLSDLGHVRTLELRDARSHLVLDPTTLGNLEVFRNSRDGGRKGTLVAVLDRTATAPGGRTLRDWLRRPLKDPDAIATRHAAVAVLVAENRGRDALRERLARVADPDRLLGRAVLGTLSPREAAALRDTLRELPGLLAELAALPGLDASELLCQLTATDPLPELAAELDRVLAEAPHSSLAEGGVIATGIDEELDLARSLAQDSKRHILALEAHERERTKIPSLKIRYNQVFGYYIEVTKANSQAVPADYIRKQTLVNAERYVTPEIKELEEQILAAEGKQIALEERYYRELVATIAAAAPGLAALAAAVGTLDTLAAFAEVAARGRFVRPRVTPAGGPIQVRDGRHPVVENSEGTTSEPFVPNDVDLDPEQQIVLLTGPNMGGKSTYLRQVALIVLMAQAGSFVPATAAEISVVDRIFTRVGASDDLARGESTFMVEMIETANILHAATAESLVILDEVGRGTATFDGLSLAWAIVEYLHEHATRRPKTLFATHYHELTELASLLPRVVNRTLAVREWEDRIVFLRRVVNGSADKSYGIHVARLAGMPPRVLERAEEVLKNLEAQEYDLTGTPRLARGEMAPPPPPGSNQLALFAPPGDLVLDTLRQLDVDQLTPLAALNLLHTLKARL